MHFLQQAKCHSLALLYKTLMHLMDISLLPSETSGLSLSVLPTLTSNSSLGFQPCSEMQLGIETMTFLHPKYELGMPGKCYEGAH